MQKELSKKSHEKASSKKTTFDIAMNGFEPTPRSAKSWPLKRPLNLSLVGKRLPRASSHGLIVRSGSHARTPSLRKLAIEARPPKAPVMRNGKTASTPSVDAETPKAFQFGVTRRPQHVLSTMHQAPSLDSMRRVSAR